MFRQLPFNRRGTEIARRNDPWGLRSFFDEFFNDSFFPTFLPQTQPIRTDVRETDKEYIVEAEIPGVDKEDIKIELRDDILTIGVEHKEEVNEERQDYIRKERRYGAFSRSFNVENIKQQDISAKYDKGILTLILPKAQEKVSRGRRIEIQ